MSETPDDLLAVAERLLGDDGSTPRSRDVRTAATLGRSVLETVVTDLCRSYAVDAGRTSMRVRLICLRAVGDSQVYAAAAAAWWMLSRACHQHSYEIEPHFTEVRTALELVRQLLAAGVVAPS
jgi:hypothetical protein